MDEFECRVFPQALDVLGPTRAQVVEANHGVSAPQQRLTQMRTEKTAATRHGNAHGFSPGLQEGREMLTQSLERI
ncbi:MULTISPECIES: hypothetical protein [Streptomyces]|uniref:hypothetical protein n=1 Tax=Streptomyces TaxID=1883 RepID=UPI00210B74B7|nr:hypothetical protein [Streptomyces sp. PAN_FS17]